MEKAGLLAGVKMRLVKTDGDLRMRGADLKAAIQQDRTAGLIPFFVCNFFIFYSKLHY